MVDSPSNRLECGNVPVLRDFLLPFRGNPKPARRDRFFQVKVGATSSGKLSVCVLRGAHATKKIDQESVDRRDSVSFSVRIRIAHRIPVPVGHKQGRNFRTEKTGGTSVGSEHSLYLIVPVDGGQDRP